MKSNMIVEKSMHFAVRIVRLYQYLCKEKNEYEMARQLLRAGTSIGANIREANVSMTKREFIMKSNIALKEASETEFWIELLYLTDYLTPKQYYSIMSDCQEINRMLTSIIKTSNKNV